MTWTNYHSHSSYCDGSQKIAPFIKKAVENGMHAFGISNHGPLPLETSWSMQSEDLPNYLKDIQRLRTEWQNHIEIYAGLEIDFVPGTTWWDQIGPLYRELDYVIGSIHLVDGFEDGKPWKIDGSNTLFEKGLQTIFNGDIQAAVSRYYELTRWMVMLENPDVVGHLDKIKVQNLYRTYFLETEPWYRHEIDKTLKVIANMGGIVEVNTRGLYTGKSLDLFPSQWILEKIYAMNIPITLSSDAHKPKEVTAGFRLAAQILNKVGFKTTTVLKNGIWQSCPLTTKGLEMDWSPSSENQSA